MQLDGCVLVRDWLDFWLALGNMGRLVAAVRDRDPETEAAAAAAEARGMEACGYDPVVRVRFQEEADIEAEVLNPTRMLAIMRNPDVAVVQACSQVYNDWAAEFVSYDPKRFVGVSVIPMEVSWIPGFMARLDQIDDNISRFHLPKLSMRASDYMRTKEHAFVQLLQSRLVDGLLITPCAGDHAFLKPLLRKPLPIVFLSRYIRGLPIPAVVTDNEAGAFLGVSHLIVAGRRKIAAVLARKGLSVTADRLRGYRRALKAAGLRLEGRWVVEGGLPFDGAVETVESLMRLKQPPDAFFTFGSMQTLAALNTFLKLGRQCPEEMALVGFSEHQWAAVTNPPVTCIAQPTRTIAATGVQLLVEAMHTRRPLPPEIRKLPPTLIDRLSCGCGGAGAGGG